MTFFSKSEIFPVVLLCLLLAGCAGTAASTSAPDSGGAFEAEVAPLEGEALAPNGKYQVRLEGVNKGVTAAGLYAPEEIQIVSVESGDVLWQDMGYYHQSVLWSPTGRYVAIARTARTHVLVSVIETERFTVWDVAMPDGTAIPEYTFLPRESWGEWLDEDTLQLKVGGTGDGETASIYRCLLYLENSCLSGTTLEQTSEKLPGKWDLDHGGSPETAEPLTVWKSEQAADMTAQADNPDQTCGYPEDTHMFFAERKPPAMPVALI